MAWGWGEVLRTTRNKEELNIYPTYLGETRPHLSRGATQRAPAMSWACLAAGARGDCGADGALRIRVKDAVPGPQTSGIPPSELLSSAAPRLLLIRRLLEDGRGKRGASVGDGQVLSKFYSLLKYFISALNLD